MISQLFPRRFLKKGTLFVTACLGFFAPCVQAGESYIAAEAYSGKILLELDADQKRPVASLTKIATALSLIPISEPTRPY